MQHICITQHNSSMAHMTSSLSAFLFGSILIGFVGVHTYYILKNETTIEHISQRPTEVRVDFDESGHNYEVVTMHYNEKLWDVGYVYNWRAVMGKNPWTWFGNEASIINVICSQQSDRF